MVRITDELNNPQWAGEVSSQTRLSIREAELYILHVELDKTLDECAEKMSVDPGTAYSTWNRVKEKIKGAEKEIRKAEETAKLEIP